jgi:hypothetical protein
MEKERAEALKATLEQQQQHAQKIEAGWRV